MLSKHIGTAVLAASMLFVAPVAHAADPSEGEAAAESLFQEARKLVGAGRYQEACPMFLASYKLSPAVGVLLNLADCYEKSGQYASAWARFHEAIAMAERLGRSDRERTARERAKALEPKLHRVTITSREPDAHVKLDGHAMEPSVLGTAIPIDPGKHIVEASAQGKKSLSTAFDVSNWNRTISIEIPPLEEEDVSAQRTAKAEPKRVVDWNRDAGHTQRVIGIVAMSAGAVGIGVGAFFGFRTSSKWSEAQNHCPGNECEDQKGVDLARNAKDSATISTAACIAGGTLLAGGLVIYLTAPNNRSSSAIDGTRVRLGAGPGSIFAVGTF
jgi:hypothetical protein